jgi:hypothetical protein
VRVLRPSRVTGGEPRPSLLHLRNGACRPRRRAVRRTRGLGRGDRLDRRREGLSALPQASRRNWDCARSTRSASGLWEFATCSPARCRRGPRTAVRDARAARSSRPEPGWDAPPRLARAIDAPNFDPLPRRTPSGIAS